VDVLLERREDDEGIIILSKEKAAKIKIWTTSETSMKREDDPGKIIAVSKAACPWISAFLHPTRSQINLKPIKDNTEKD